MTIQQENLELREALAKLKRKLRGYRQTFWLLALLYAVMVAVILFARVPLP